MNTKKLKQLVLDLAIHGKLVPQDPNDEPASELLKRIQADVETRGRASNKSKGKKSAVSSVDLDEVPFEVPEGWCWTTVENAYVINPKNDSSDDAIAGFVPMANVGDGFSNRFVCEERPWKDIKKGFTHFQNGDVAVAKISPCMENRKSVVFADLPNGIGAGTTELNVFRSLINSLYSLYFFKTEYFIARCASTFLGTVGQQRVDKEVLLSIFIPLPPLAEQHRIVAAIEKWFAVIDQLEKNEADLKKSIEQTKKKVLDLAIRGKLVAQNPEDEPAGELLARIRADVETHGRASNKAQGKKSAIPSVDLDEVPFEVPAGWEWCRLGEVGKWQSGSTPSRTNKSYYGGDIPWLKTGDLNDGLITEIPEFITEEALNNTSVKLNPTDSVLIAMYGATIGKVGILTFPATTNQACCACSEYCVEKMYLFYFLIQERERFIYKAGGGAQPNISKEIILDTFIPVPPLAEQRRIVEKIEEVFGVLERIEGMM